MIARILEINANDLFCEVNNEIKKLHAPGKWKYQKIKLVANDLLELNERNEIIKLVERKNYLVRPKVANLDYVILVFSVKDPLLNLKQLFKFLVYFESKLEFKPLIAFSKLDLIDNSDDFEEIYQALIQTGYQVFRLNNNDDFLNLKTMISDKISLFCGHSGVGKSTLIKRLDNTLNIWTQEVSNKLKRGKNTTTSTKLYKFLNGYIVDSPGFSIFNLEITKQELSYGLLEFKKYQTQCKFKDCMHLENSIDCCVKKQINSLIYKIYLSLLQSII
ncbi:ribosome small subunit-dependent GTPase A [Mycoplasma bradburyae]|uniref:ribosome small subunit-dependent GTPase A n=1 Tax=Mycoplasma bradburyae TaxID=2963128 RepID=UPI0023402864|nr:ribosome small subunit-dependent GTPase A [Mycoplasma bradburyae]MDC4184367.1 ribosome small subunit-dependent GTPase A [Mycoplasma bradburyae]